MTRFSWLKKLFFTADNAANTTPRPVEPEHERLSRLDASQHIPRTGKQPTNAVQAVPRPEQPWKSAPQAQYEAREGVHGKNMVSQSSKDQRQPQPDGTTHTTGQPLTSNLAEYSQLEEKDRYINFLEAQIDQLKRSYDEQFSSMRNELGSYQSQLDNVQRFIATADAHADQDIIQKLLELSEEVYQTSMTMVDSVIEGFTRRSAAENRTNVDTSVGDINGGKGTPCYFPVAVKEENIASILQITLQDCLVRMLSLIVSSWSVSEELDNLLKETYQNMRKTETQAVSGRWRFLTCTHIQHTFREPESLIRKIIADLSGIIVAAGFSPSTADVESKLSAEFKDEISTIVSHSWKFSNMVAGMVSGDFEVFVVQPGAPFEEESMIDMIEGPGAWQGTGTAQTVAYVTRVGLRKQVGERMMTLTKAEVVLNPGLALSTSGAMGLL